MSPTKSFSKPIKVTKQKSDSASLRKNSKEQIGVLYPLPESEITPAMRAAVRESKKKYRLMKGSDLLNI